MARHHRVKGDPGLSQRQLRVGELVRHVLADLLARGEVHDPVIEGHMITVSEVRMTADLRLATIYVMPLGGVKLNETVAVLNNMVGFFRHYVAQNVKLRYVPKLIFSPDRSFEYAQRISEILNDPEVAKDLGPDDRDDD